MIIPEDYIPFGEEWKKEMMKHKKEDLVLLYKSSCVLNQQYKKEIENLKKQFNNGNKDTKTS